MTSTNFFKIKIFLLVALCLHFTPVTSQSERKEDLSLWTWFQVEKKILRSQYIEFQYQARFDENITQFNRSNIYFIYGNNFRRHFNLELLYQLNENYRKDQHTFYAGLTYKHLLSSHWSVSFRTALQNTRYYFTGDYIADKTYNEWRNRLRLVYKVNRSFSLTASAEPYLLFKPTRSPYYSRIRYVGQVTYKYNKYQEFTLFYLEQPDLISYSVPKTNYVFGIAYHITLPNKAEGYKKIFTYKE